MTHTLSFGHSRRRPAKGITRLSGEEGRTIINKLPLVFPSGKGSFSASPRGYLEQSEGYRNELNRFKAITAALAVGTVCSWLDESSVTAMFDWLAPLSTAFMGVMTYASHKNYKTALKNLDQKFSEN